MEYVEKYGKYVCSRSLCLTRKCGIRPAEKMRRIFANNSPESIKRSFLNYYAKVYPSITATKTIDTSNDLQSNRFTILEQYQVESFWESSESGKDAYLYASTIKPFVKRPEAIHRTAPLAIPHPVSVRHQSSIMYPENIDYKIKNELVTIQNPFISYRRAVSYIDRKLAITHDYSSREDTIMPKYLASYIRDLNKINNNLYYTTWVSDVPATSPAESMVNNLLDRLDTILSH